MTKEYPQGFGCIPANYGYFECLLTDENLESFSPKSRPQITELEKFIKNDLSRKIEKKLLGNDKTNNI